MVSVDEKTLHHVIVNQPADWCDNFLQKEEDTFVTAYLEILTRKQGVRRTEPLAVIT